MNAVDTNVLIYVHDDREPNKKAKARELIDDMEDGLLLWQVACEYLPPLASYRHKNTRWMMHETTSTISEGFGPPLFRLGQFFERSGALIGRYSLSFWEALLVAACLEAGVETLYTENFGGCDEIDGVRIVNPFAAAN